MRESTTHTHRTYKVAEKTDPSQCSAGRQAGQVRTKGGVCSVVVREKGGLLVDVVD
jgi:hypothetical protein